jgi:hypothetical protein
MTHETHPPRDREKSSPFQGYLDYHNIGKRTPRPEREAEARQARARQPKWKNLTFNFSVGEVSFEAKFPQERRFDGLSLEEKVLFGIGQSAGFSQTSEAQAQYVQNIALKADAEEEIPFEDRLHSAIEQEIAEGRVAVRSDGLWELTPVSVEAVQAAIERTKPKR